MADKRRIIINNNSNESMHDALRFVAHVIAQGRISETSKGKQYCFLTTWSDGLAVSATINKNSDSFTVWNQKKQS